MKTTYEITEETYSSGLNTRTSYGITVYIGNHKNGSAVIAGKVHDITSDKQALTELIAQCNRLELSPIHLQDVVEDFLER